MDRTVASGGLDSSVKVWDLGSGKLVRTLEGSHSVWSVAVSPTGNTIVAGGHGPRISVWQGDAIRPVRKLAGHNPYVESLAFDPDGFHLASGGDDRTVKLWDPNREEIVTTLVGHGGPVASVAFSPDGLLLASASEDRTVKVWETKRGKLLRTLEGHDERVNAVDFSSEGQLLASRSRDGTVRLWSCHSWKPVAVLQPRTYGLHPRWMPGLAFHPHAPLLATVGSPLGEPGELDDCLIHILALDFRVLLRQPSAPSIAYTSAKVVLVGDSGVGKTGLGWRLAHGEFKEHASTHGQQFWSLEQLSTQRSDGTQCEAVLWDLAGQPDYRLIHALFIDDADLALVLFDPTKNDDPLSGVEFWLKQLKVGDAALAGPPTLLIAARSDRGAPRLVQAELELFCKQRGLVAYVPTSAKAGDGINDLLQLMRGLISWDDKPSTVTTETFKRIKDHVLGLKENRRRRKVIITPGELRQRLAKSKGKWRFSDEEMMTAVGHLQNHGYVKLLRTTPGMPRILLAPELLNNLAASFVLEARRNQKGLGSLEEQKLLAGGYTFPELADLSEAEQAIMLDAATVLFLKHHVCFREVDPLHGGAYLVFPELINLKRPLEDNGKPVADGMAYTASGAIENVYASLVVLMGYTQTFTRTSQWRNHARYEVGNGEVCGFRLEEERSGELDFVLYFGTGTAAPVQMLFQSLFENFLARRNLTVRRLQPVICSKGHPLNRTVVREQIASGAPIAFCGRCGERLMLPKTDQPIQLTQQQAEEVEANRRAADQRSRFEQVLFRLNAHVTEQGIAIPECFISYAWGIPDHEYWVERVLATDLQKAGVAVVLDRWENTRIGASVPRFVERVGKSDRVIVVATPLYRKKYENDEPMRGFVAAAEGDLIGKRMIGTEAQKESVLPVLLEGTEESAFPSLLQGRVYADFRDQDGYFAAALQLLLSLYQIKTQHPFAVDLRESLAAGKNLK